MRRKQRDKRQNHDRWLVSYADFITLLFAFFVVMYASSQVDKNKMMAVAASIQDAFHDMGVFQGQRSSAQNAPAAKTNKAPPELRALVEAAVEQKVHQQGVAGRDLEPLKRDIEKALEEEIKKGAVTLRPGPDGLVISLSELGFFESGSATMRKAAEDSFDRIARLLADRRCGVRVEGHTDNVPIRTSEFRSNWDLSAARAIDIVKRLIDQYHVEPALLSAAGYGEYHPVATNSTMTGRQQNRRVDLVVLSHEDAQRMIPAVSNDAFAMSGTKQTNAAPEEQHQ